MRSLSNESLIETYFKALDLKLDNEFINLLLDEIRRRNINLSKQTRGA